MSNGNSIKPVFVISAGRSGSTLLQRYLNSSDDLLIWGEHDGFISGLSETYYRFADHQYAQDLLVWGRKRSKLLLGQRKTLRGVDIQWTNNFTLDDWKTVYRDLILRLLTIDVSPSLRWGFKEIRYGEREIRLLKELFPEAQFIFLVRHPMDAIASMIAAWFQPENVWKQESWRNKTILPELQDFISQQCLRTIKVGNGILRYLDEGYLIKYEELKENPYAILSDTCTYLNIEPLAIEKVKLISSDIRMATNSKAIKETLHNNFVGNEKIQEVCNLYDSFGYSCIP